jgi:hypothetical protein
VIDPDKYIVFKREEFVTWWRQPSVGGTMNEIHCPDELRDSVVIRLKDPFAESALNSYAQSVQTAIEVLRMIPSAAFPPLLEHLREIADYFAGNAEKARMITERKIPD